MTDSASATTTLSTSTPPTPTPPTPTPSTPTPPAPVYRHDEDILTTTTTPGTGLITGLTALPKLPLTPPVTPPAINTATSKKDIESGLSDNHAFINTSDKKHSISPTTPSSSPSPLSSMPTTTKVYLDGYSGSSRWITYLKERVQLPVYIICNSGLVLSGYYLYAPYGVAPEAWRVVWGVLSLSWLFLTLRLMDDHKDWETDVLAHPERPLPRGLLTPIEVRNSILFILVPVCLANSLLLALYINWQSGVAFLAATIFQVLMWVEFGIGHILEKNPFIYAVMHQPVILIYFCYAVSMFHFPSVILNSETLLWAAGILGCTFSYEVARKLDPLAHPALGTYLVAHTRTPTFLIIVSMNLLAAAAAYKTKVGILCWPFEGGVTLLALFVLYGTKNSTPPPYMVDGKQVSREEVLEEIQRGERQAVKGYKYVELLATLSVVVHYWAVAFKWWGNGSVKF
ncbi:hypothetical protein HDV05_008721 [Chytridiales sp. JEL 0842]|nr:hypothetical protein HDV05_008721 [Chytridiales sp. JEL 0842]